MGVVYILSLWQTATVLFNYQEPLREKPTVRGDWKRDEGKKKKSTCQKVHDLLFFSGWKWTHPPGQKQKVMTFWFGLRRTLPTPRGTRNDGSRFWVPLVPEVVWSMRVQRFSIPGWLMGVWADGRVGRWAGSEESGKKIFF